MRCAVPELLTHPQPVDGQAAKELRHWSSVRPQKRPLTLVNADPRDIARRVSNFTDLRGVRFGDMTVVGLVEFERGGKSVWSVVCKCGNYETRGNRLIKRFMQHPDCPVDDACRECMTPARLAARDESKPRWLKSKDMRWCAHNESFA